MTLTTWLSHSLRAGAVAAVFACLAGPASAGFIAGIDLEIAGNHDNDANTPNIFWTEPGYLSVPLSGSKDYNVTTNGVTFDLNGESISGNANRFRTGAITAFPLLADFFQLFSSGGVPTLTATISGLDPNTNYVVSFFNHNQGSFQDTHEFYEGAIAPANLIGTFKSDFNTNDPANTSAGVDWNLTSDGSGQIVVSIQAGDDGDGNRERITLNGISVSSAPVPEPASLALLGLGGLAVAWRFRK